ncbi:MAG: DUF1643 domain-containing protein, partial [Muribaculaceae bacterium]|nr:DUF1643 domain-containing protein [Muribaculaceae bacterium]
MNITQRMINEAKKYAWQNEDAYIHLASDGDEPEDYIGFWFDGEYILNPWTEYSKIPINDPFKTFGTENIENLVIELLAKNDIAQLTDDNCPAGQIYIGDGEVRYALGEIGCKNLFCIGVNPSNADLSEDDPTVCAVRT